MKTALINFYLDWVNNYLTVARMLEDYELSEDDWRTLINLGRKYHERNVELIKTKQL